MPVAPLYALSGLGTLGLALVAGSQGEAIIVSAVCAIAVVACDLLSLSAQSNGFLLAAAGALRRNACRSRRVVGLG